MTKDAETNQQLPAAREAMLTKARAGGLNGPAPLGYVNRRVDGETVVELDPVTAPLVKEAFLLAARKSASLRAIGKVMANKGLASRHGMPLSATALWRILTNPFYIGIIRYETREFQGGHPALINVSTFREIQINLAKRRRATHA